MVTVGQQHQQQQQQQQQRRPDDFRFRIEKDSEEPDRQVNFREVSLRNRDNGFDSGSAELSVVEVESIHEDGKSTQCSDLEDGDEDEDEVESLRTGWMPSLPVPVPGIVHEQQVISSNGGLALPYSEPPEFGDVCVKNSTNVHLGNKTLYKGSFTIKQFVYGTSPNSNVTGGNGGSANGRVSDANASDLSGTKCEESSSSGPILPNSARNYQKVAQWLWSWQTIAFLGTFSLILITTIICSVVLTRETTYGPPVPSFPQIPDSSIDGVILDKVRFVERIDWGAQPPAEELDNLTTVPTPYVIISHTASEFCSQQAKCALIVRNAQVLHVESKGWSDIGYSFLVGGDGLAYVGRGWDKAGAHTFGFNYNSIGISFIGTFNDVIPSKRQLNAAQKLIEAGVKGGKIAKDYKLLGHRQVSATLSPGDALYATIKTWPHWSAQP